MLKIQRTNIYSLANNINKIFLLCKRDKTHYEVLKLSPNCTQKDIRDAFIHMSKENHPDTSKTTGNSEQFTEIIEAYRILGKQELRSSYDMALQRGQAMQGNHSRDIVNEPWKVDPSQYRNQYQQPDEYYGVYGVRRMSNWSIVISCIIFAGIGITMQIVAIHHSSAFKRSQLDVKSIEYGTQHSELRAEVEKYGNEMQLKRIISRLPNK